MEEELTRPRLLFESGCLPHFAVYLHESRVTGGPCDIIQVSSTPMHGPATRSPAGLGADTGDAQAEGKEPEEILSVEGLPFVLRRRMNDLFIEFPRSQPSVHWSDPGSGSPAGCWYGCEVSDDESAGHSMGSQEAVGPASPCRGPDHPRGELSPRRRAAAVAGVPGQAAPTVPAGPSRTPDPWARPREGHLRTAGLSTDRGWNALRLASWTWLGCDLGAAVGAAAGARPPAPEAGTLGEAVGAEDPCAESDGAWYWGGSSRRPPGGPEAEPRAERGPSELVHFGDARVEWTLWGITARAKESAKGGRIFSPDFVALGVSPLSLVFYPNGNSNAKPGFCSLGLKVPHGTHLRYRLYVGSVERFTDLRHDVTESWGFVDMCKLDDEVLRDEDLLRLGVEIIDDIDAHEVLRSVSGSKVEWSIGNMQKKLAHYRKDVALHSEEFSVGCVKKLRLKFYPAGKKEAELGWCSLYLEAPKGTELRCRLSVGERSMSFDRVEKFGEDSVWGFLALCRLQEELEGRETARLGLEVLEAGRPEGRLSEAEDAYLEALGRERRARLLGELDRVERLRAGEGAVPPRFRILQLELPDRGKAAALAKLDAAHSESLSGEGSKLKRWVDGLLSIPFGIVRKPLVSMEEGGARVRQYLDSARVLLNDAVYGHEEPKRKILQLLCQWIANPDSQSLVLGIQGPPGNGKTTLCRRGIAEALGRPFVQVSLGGATDASVLEGHSYTYVGSTWGRIASLVMEAQCMNPVIFFDELDKVSDTPRGEEIIGVLTHLTDHSQNKTFSDKYFDGIPLDLSRALFVFSFNDESRLNTVLKDRLTIIHTDGFDQAAKLRISRDYLLPELLANVGLRRGDVDIGREELSYLCQRCGVPAEEGGVRGVRRSLESAVLRINELRMTQAEEEIGEEPATPPGAATAGGGQQRPRIQLPLMLTRQLIEKLVAQSRSEMGALATMYA